MPPYQAPPSRYEGVPRRFFLPTGARLTRIHSAAFGVVEFNLTVARSDLRGRRFDSTPGDDSAFLYAADHDPTAVSEVLLRDLPIDDYGARLLPRVRLSELRIGWFSTTLELELVSLRSGVDLAALGQDSWLTTASAADYAMTRRLVFGDPQVGAVGERPDLAITSRAGRFCVYLLLGPLPCRLLRGGDRRPAATDRRPQP